MAPTEPTDPTDETGLRNEAAVLEHLLNLENGGMSADFPLGPFTAFILVQLAQLGVKRVGVADPMSEVFRACAARLEPYFEQTAAGEVLRAGWAEMGM